MPDDYINPSITAIFSKFDNVQTDIGQEHSHKFLEVSVVNLVKDLWFSE